MLPTWIAVMGASVALLSPPLDRGRCSPFYGLFRWGHFEQTGPDEAVDLGMWKLDVWCHVYTCNNAMAWAQLERPNTAEPLALIEDPFATQRFDFETYFPSRAALDEAFPPEVYTLRIGGGAWGESSVTMDFDESVGANWPIMVTPASYSALQGMDPSVPMTIEFEAIDAPAFIPPEERRRTIYIHDERTGDIVYFDDAPVGATSAIVDARDLMPGRDHRLEIIASIRDRRALGFTGLFEDLNGGVGDAARTQVYFTTSGPPRCNRADLAPPYEVHDFSDLLVFLELFIAQDPTANLFEPYYDEFDFSDVSLFLYLFDHGCQ